MPHLARRGFTLIELMVALVLLGIISAAIYRVLITDQRIYQAQTQRIDLQQNIRSAATVLPTELRVLNASDGDIIAMSSDSITIRAMRVFGVACNPPVLGGVVTGRAITVRQALTYGSRAFANQDSVLVYYEGDASARSDDGWVRGKVTAAPTAANCPGDARAGTLLTVDLEATPWAAPKVNTDGKISSGAPVWGYEIVTYRLYQSTDGLWYIGLRTTAGGLQPLIGPLSGATGLTLNYYTSAGAVTAATTQVAEIEIRVRARTAQSIQLPEGGRVTPVDSVITRVALRNNRRW